MRKFKVGDYINLQDPLMYGFKDNPVGIIISISASTSIFKNMYVIRWYEYKHLGTLRYYEDSLKLVMNQFHLDFQDKIKDRLNV